MTRYAYMRGDVFCVVESSLLHLRGQIGGEILRKQGFDFQAMEVRVKQLVREEEINRVKGGWFTESDLAQKGWTESWPRFIVLHHMSQFYRRLLAPYAF